MSPEIPNRGTPGPDKRNAREEEKAGPIEIFFTVIGIIIVGVFVFAGLVLSTCFLSI